MPILSVMKHVLAISHAHDKKKHAIVPHVKAVTMSKLAKVRSFVSHAVKFPEIGGGIWDRIGKEDTPDLEALARRSRYEKEWELRERLSGHSDCCERTGASIEEIAVFHSELLNTSGDREAIYAMIQRYRIEAPQVIISVLFRKGFRIFKNSYENRKIRVLLAEGKALS